MNEARKEAATEKAGQGEAVTKGAFSRFKDRCKIIASSIVLATAVSCGSDNATVTPPATDGGCESGTAGECTDGGAGGDGGTTTDGGNGGTDGGMDSGTGGMDSGTGGYDGGDGGDGGFGGDGGSMTDGGTGGDGGTTTDGGSSGDGGSDGGCMVGTGTWMGTIHKGDYYEIGNYRFTFVERNGDNEAVVDVSACGVYLTTLECPASSDTTYFDAPNSKTVKVNPTVIGVGSLNGTFTVE
ncbi:MAG: hypothetical protein AB1324_01650 [Candidatus Micrarchaeota archaeon]